MYVSYHVKKINLQYLSIKNKHEVDRDKNDLKEFIVGINNIIIILFLILTQLITQIKINGESKLVCYFL